MISNIYSLVECVVGGSFVIWGFVACINVKSVQQFVKFFVSKNNSPLTHALFFALLPFGLAIIFSHNDWVLNASVLVTLTGWAITVKCILWFAIPNQMRKFIEIKLWVKPMFIRGYGALSVILGLLILYPYFVV